VNNWQPIETAPKDSTHIDLYAKFWVARDDDFIHRRFTDCSWMRPDSMTGKSGYWYGVDEGWRATHWMPLPEPPDKVLEG
jgi:hypothetical protein